MVKTRIFLFLFILLECSLIKAQIRFGSPTVSNFSRIVYQAGTQNWAVVQSPDGIMYFANNKGVLEFDGTNWQIIPLSNGTITRSLTFDEANNLYIGGQDEFGILKKTENGRSYYQSLTPLIPEKLRSFDDIWKIFKHTNGVYFCSEKLIFKLANDKISTIAPQGSLFENFFQLNNTIYIQDKEKGLFVLENEELSPIKNGNTLSNQRITAILPFDNIQSLVVTFSNGLYLLNEEGLSSWNVGASDFLKEHQAFCAIELFDGNYAIGTPQNGLLLMDRNGKPYLHINKNKGLQNNTVLSICQDQQKNLWLGLDNGLDYVEISSPFSNILPEQGITGTGYASIVHNGNLYLGTNQGLFYTDMENSGNTLESKKFKPVNEALGQVWSINPLESDIIVGQHKGASKLVDDRVYPFSKIEGAWKFKTLEAHPGYAVEGTYLGFYLYKNLNTTGNRAPKWELVGKIDGFDESARIFEEDTEGNIWVSHAYKGLYKITLSPDLKSIATLRVYSTEDGLPGDLLINVGKIRNEIIFTTPKGIFVFDKTEDKFLPHKEFSEIFGPDRNVHRLIEDKVGNIWFSIDREFGVIKVKEEGLFNKVEKVYFNQIQEELVDGFEHIYAYDEQNYIIGTEKGFIHYTPSNTVEDNAPFKVLIREITNITERDSVIYWAKLSSAPFTEKDEFHHKMNDFRFSYSAPYYEKIQYLNYRYFLEGFDRDWSKWSPKTEKEYTNLPSGDYRFKVQAKNAYDQISSEEVYTFRIAPPWYFSWYAKIIYFIFGTSVLIGLIRFVSVREKKKTEAFKKEQTKKLEQREAEYKEEVKKSENEVIRLRNEKLETDINHKNSQLASATMNLVQKSEILNKIKNDLDNIQKEANPMIKKRIQQITRTIDSNIQLENNWEQFETYFDQVHQNFFKRLRSKYPELTPKDQKLCAYLRMNLTTKEIAPLLNISVRGVEISRYRLRKKLGLESETNLVAFIMDI